MIRISELQPGEQFTLLGKTYTKVDSQWMEDRAGHYFVLPDGKIVKSKMDIIVESVGLKPSEVLEAAGYPGDDDSDPRLGWWKKAAAIAFEMAKYADLMFDDDHDANPEKYEQSEFNEWAQSFDKLAKQRYELS